MQRPLPVQTRKVLEVLTDQFATPTAIARDACLPGRERTSAAERICEALERRGLAERGGSKQQPKWRRLPNSDIDTARV
ncbi:hypothetical protein LDDCCGHA_1704 [Methylobacterium oxalidis]|nr:hypothetical protein LDDCCGHA_1704 [Methylobacterium oxalidis]